MVAGRAGEDPRPVIDTAALGVGDIPGEASDDVRIALVSRLIATGLLEVAT